MNPQQIEIHKYVVDIYGGAVKPAISDPTATKIIAKYTKILMIYILFMRCIFFMKNSIDADELVFDNIQAQ